MIKVEHPDFLIVDGDKVVDFNQHRVAHLQDGAVFGLLSMNGETVGGNAKIVRDGENGGQEEIEMNTKPGKFDSQLFPGLSLIFD